jgi:uncharacterized phage protein (TIGR02220 family)
MRLEPELLLHPKFRRLKRRVGDLALEYLVMVWGHCQQNKRGEFWPGADEDYLEDLCQWSGKNGELYGAMIDSGFVHEEEDGLRIHDWNDMNSGFIANWKTKHKGRKATQPTADQVQTNCEPTADQVQTNCLTVEKCAKSDSAETPMNPPKESVGNQLVSTCRPSAPNQTKPDCTQRGSGGDAPRDFVGAQAVLAELNRATGQNFIAATSHLHAIADRLREVCLHEQCSPEQAVWRVCAMIARQVAMWQNDPKMRQFLRPGTLFHEEKFHDYYGQRNAPLAKANGQHKAPVIARGELLQQVSVTREKLDKTAPDDPEHSVLESALQTLRQQLACTT